MFKNTTRHSRSFFTIVMLLFTAACFEHTYTASAGAPNAPVVYSRWHNRWLGGADQSRPIDRNPADVPFGQCDHP